MFKLNLLAPQFYLLCLVFMAAPTLAQVPSRSSSPSQEFWDYVEEYSDENGNVLDPLEYSQVIDIKSGGKLAVKEAQQTGESESHAKPKVSNVDMKSEQKSSGQVSSSAMKGAKL